MTAKVASCLLRCFTVLPCKYCDRVVGLGVVLHRQTYARTNLASYTSADRVHYQHRRSRLSDSGIDVSCGAYLGQAGTGQLFAHRNYRHLWIHKHLPGAALYGRLSRSYGLTPWAPVQRPGVVLSKPCRLFLSASRSRFRSLRIPPSALAILRAIFLRGNERGRTGRSGPICPTVGSQNLCLGRSSNLLIGDEGLMGWWFISSSMTRLHHPPTAASLTSSPRPEPIGMPSCCMFANRESAVSNSLRGSAGGRWCRMWRQWL
jgi:hypothetical protein